jgi:lipopolysaccharide/colanic/teichoic acid biosynthesis glycosyltransferase
MLKGTELDVEILTPELDKMGVLAIGRFGRTTTALVSRGPLGLRDQALKRIFDVLVASAGLLLLAPVLALIAIAIKLESPGPILFRQPRVGLSNRAFTMYKFRSMRAEETDQHGRQHTLRNDPRVTRLGAFLRKTSLDELPQLLNVLQGTMSIVGPRPHATGSLAGKSLFWEVDDRYWHRHAVKPGMTGLAQVRGHRGSTFEESDLSHRLQSDLEYLTGWSIWRDLGILLSTSRVLVHRRAF